MTLYEFCALPEGEQVEEVGGGAYLWFRENTDCLVLLFKVHTFFVEVYCDKQHHQLVCLKAFNSQKRLALYYCHN